MPITIYTAPETRGEIIVWYLKELHIPHDAKEIDYRGGENKQPWFLELNPFHSLPTINDNGYVLFESGAILLYLQNKYGAQMSSEELGVISQWVLFANSTILEAYADMGELTRLLCELDPVLKDKEFLVGNRLTAADIALGSYLLNIPAIPCDLKLWEWPNVYRYISALAARPACTQSSLLQQRDEEESAAPVA